MTDDELSRWIAKKLEPWDLTVPHPKCSPTCAVDHDIFPEVSPLRFWRLKTRPEWHWQPRDMVNDTTMTLMLLNSLVERWEVFLSNDDAGWEFELIPRSKDTYAQGGGNKNLGRAVAEAWALANGFGMIGETRETTEGE